MLNVLSAEAQKLARSNGTLFLVWLYPIAFLTLSLISIASGLSVSGRLEGATALPAGEWIDDTLLVWLVPTHPFGRTMVSAYVAFVFAGEYGWNTWKLIVPHRPRWVLLLPKYVLIFLLLSLAYLLTAALAVLMSLLDSVLTGDPIPAGLTGRAIVEAHWRSALAAVPPVLLTIAYTSLAAILTRSTIAALLIGLVIAAAEQAFVDFGATLSVYLPGLIWFLYHGLPGYYVANLADWIREGAALREGFPDGRAVALHWAISLASISAWCGLLVSLTLLAFKRQDIN